MPIKTMRYYKHPPEGGKFVKKFDSNTKYQKGYGAMENSYTIGRNINWYEH